MAVTSEPGQGSTFVVSLPAAVEPVQGRHWGPSGSRGVILVAEDDDDLRNVLSRVLLRAGFRVIAAQNGDVARAEDSHCRLLGQCHW